MAKYKCIICGYIYDEDVEKVKFTDLPADWKCPMCGTGKENFEKISEETKEEKVLAEPTNVVEEIQQMATTGETIISAMGTRKPIISWDDILLLGCQLNPAPLLTSDDISLKTVIGHNAKKPMVIDMPVYVTHMSFGALSKEAKTALAIGSAKAKTAICSGEGGILPEERVNAYKYIFEIIPNMYSVTDDNLKNADAIEIKIGQGTKPGMGGHLPASKVTEEIAKIRGKKMGEDIISPSKFSNINSKEDLKNFVNELRKRSAGRPIGIKIAAGHIEDDLDYICFAEPDFITIDGRGGATGASPKDIKDATSVPTIYALARASKYLKDHHQDIDLVITGGLRLPADFAKALAMGATAIAIGTSAMIGIGCQQFRLCHLGKCPLGIATQDPKLRKNFNIELSSQKLANYFKVVENDLKTFARITNHHNIHDLSINDIVTTNKEISDYTTIKHV
jgi:methylamine---glutamate N-methyltransferase subunit C